MFEHNYPRRTRKFRIAFFALVVTSILSIAAAGSYSAAFSFAGSAAEFLGLKTAQARLPQRAGRTIPFDSTVFASTLDTKASTVSCTGLPANTISWWAGEGSGLDSLGSNPGTLMNGVGFAPGKVGQAFSLDSTDDYVNVPHSTSIDLGPTQPASFVLWVKRTSTNNSATIFSKRPDCFTQVHYLLQWYGPTNMFVFGSTGAPTNGVGTTADKLPLNVWTLVAISFDGTTATMYINGEPVASHAMSFDPNTVPLAIGAAPACGDYFGGLIDNFIIVKRAMTQTEIQSIFNAGTSGICGLCSTPPSGMVGWWPGNGSANDVVNGNNGSLVNGVTYAAGKVDQAFSFTQANQQFVELPVAASALLNNSAGSIAAWVNPSATGEFDMVTAFGSGDSGQAVGFAINNGNVRIYHHTDPFDWQTAIPVSINTWTHLAYTWDGTTERLYKNGSLVDSRPRNFSYAPGWGRIGFGFINDASVFFPGLIDEVAIFSRTLDAAEVASMAAASGGMCPHCASTPGGMISWWPGEGGIDIVGTNPGTLMNGASIAAGKVGSAFSFTVAGQHVAIPDSPSLRPVSGITLDGWFKFDTSNPQAAMISKPFLTTGYNSYVMWMQGGNFNASFGGAYIAYTFAPVPGRWYYMVYTYDDATTMHRLFIDGVNVASTAMDGNAAYDSAPLLIGMDSDDGSPVLQMVGMADEVGVSGQAMSPAEVLAVYNAGISGKCRGCTEQPANPISWWRGEDNVNDAIGGNYGVLLGGATFAPGKVGRAFSFNGTTAAVRIPDSPTLDVTTEFTLGAWIKPAAIPVYPNGALVISKVGPIGNLNGYQMAVTNIGGINKIWCGFNTDGNNWPQFSVTGGNIVVGEWTYVACTYDHNTLAVHQNGVQFGSAAVGPVMVANTTSNVKLGSDDVGQQFYSGLIDEPMIFGRALSAGELQSLYDAGGLGVCLATSPATPSCGAIPPGMISWWRAEGNALDRRKGHHGALIGTTAFGLGKTQNAFNFTGGNEGVDVGTWFDRQVFSIEMWVKPNNGQLQYSNIIDNNHRSTPLRSWVLENLNNGNTYQWYSADFPAGTNILFELVPDMWQHIVITRGADRVTRGYLNRSLVGSVTTTSDIPYDGTQRIWIGNWVGGNRAFNGLIDEVSIYNRPLAESEIAAIHNADSYGKCAGSQTMDDMDGDMWSDLSIFRPSGTNGAEWWWLRSTGGNGAVQFGVATDTIVASDYTGDGKTDVAFWRPSTGQWYILRSEDFSFYAFPFGANGDMPVAADFDGDGKADPTVFRASNTTWYISRSTGGTGIVQFGAAGDKPVVEDYDGDGKADIAVFRPNGTNGAEWWIARSSGGGFATQFGSATDKAVPADYTGDGKADIAFWTPSNGYWYILRSEDFSYYAFPFGGSGDLPVPADYDGDAKADPGVFRPSNSNWYLNRSTAGVLIQQFGQTGDVPVPNAFVR